MNISINRFVQSAIFASVFISVLPALSFPQFESFIEKNSGRRVNCAMCHINPEGPMGNGEGQIGSLNAEQMKRLDEARQALDPGHDVKSPIMNEFGNHIIKTVGITKVMELTQNPQGLADALGKTNDMDGDGIPDSQEFLDGTDPLNKFNGNPWRLFEINLARYAGDIAFVGISCALIVYGLGVLRKASSDETIDK